MTTKATNRILEEMHDAAQGLHNAGFISKRRMLEYDALCLEPIPNYSSERISSLRAKNHISQSVMASILNVSLSTVRQWEGGNKRPSGPSLKLLSLLDKKGLEGLN